MQHIQSIKNKTFQIKEFISDNKLDFCLLTETWLSDNNIFIMTEATPPGYVLKAANRIDKRGGGL